MLAKSLVYFKDNLIEGEHEEHYGILFEDNTVLCFCCGGVLEDGDYIILENYEGFDNLDETLKKHFG